MDWYPLKPQTRLRRFSGSAMAYCVYAGLCDWAFDEGGLPDDPRRTAALVGLTLAEIKLAWEQFKGDCDKTESGRLMPKDITGASGKLAAVRKKRQDAGQAGGYLSGEERRARAAGNRPTPISTQPDGVNAAPFHNEPTPVDLDHLEGLTLDKALEQIFPGHTSTGIFLQCGQLASALNATPEDVLRWPEWLKHRDAGRARTHWTFKETLGEMLGEPKVLPTGARFIIATAFNLAATEHTRLTRQQFNEALNQGALLQELVKMKTAAEWRDEGYLPAAFQAYWQRHIKADSYPAPASIVKYWDAFVRSLG